MNNDNALKYIKITQILCKIISGLSLFLLVTILLKFKSLHIQLTSTRLVLSIIVIILMAICTGLFFALGEIIYIKKSSKAAITLFVLTLLSTIYKFCTLRIGAGIFNLVLCFIFFRTIQSVNFLNKTQTSNIVDISKNI